MQRLLSFREKIKSSLDKHSRIFYFIGKFIGAMIMFSVINQMFGHTKILTQPSFDIFLSVVCALIPLSYSFVIFIVMECVQLINVSTDVFLLFFVVMLLFYFIYNRSFMQYGYLAIMTFVLLATKLSVLVPIFAGIYAGALGIPPMLIGIFVYYYAVTLDDALLEITKSVDTKPLYQMVLDSMITNKELYLCIFCFIITLLIASQIYRMRVNYAWILSIPIAGVIHAILYLYGCFLLEIESSISDTIFSFLVSVIILEIIQFFRGLVDYTRVENLQFEDDDYYYYVKAVPKIKMQEEDINVKQINVRRKSLIRHRDKKE